MIFSTRWKYFRGSQKSKNIDVSLIMYWSETSKKAIKYVDLFTSTKIFSWFSKKVKISTFNWSCTDLKHSKKNNKICWFFHIKENMFFILKKSKNINVSLIMYWSETFKKEVKFVDFFTWIFFILKKSKNINVSLIMYWSETSKKAIKFVGFFQFNENIFSVLKKSKNINVSLIMYRSERSNKAIKFVDFLLLKHAKNSGFLIP